jgi:putative tricarboxylic transport membrane protein
MNRSHIRSNGGGAVAVQLVGDHVDSTVNNPIEAVAHWRAGKLRPLCVFDSKKLDYNEKIYNDLDWNSIPTCKSEGLNVEYLMLRGYFMPPGASKDAVAYYVDLFKKVQALPEWKKFSEDAAFNQTTMSGKEFTDWVAKAEQTHHELMKEAGFLAQK